MRRRPGFTLVELLVVIVILGILAAIVVFAVQNLTQQSSNAACQSDFKTTEVAAEAYKAQINTYPLTGVTALLATAQSPSSGQTVGPWLKDTPGSAKYQVVVGTSNLPTGAIGAANAKWGTGTTPAVAAGDGVIWIGTPGPQSSPTSATAWTSGISGVSVTLSGTTWTANGASGAATLAGTQTAQAACAAV
jgi:general secretion pathway protein G